MLPSFSFCLPPSPSTWLFHNLPYIFPVFFLPLRYSYSSNSDIYCSEYFSYPTSLIPYGLLFFFSSGGHNVERAFGCCSIYACCCILDLEKCISSFTYLYFKRGLYCFWIGLFFKNIETLTHLSKTLLDFNLFYQYKYVYFTFNALFCFVCIKFV